MTARLEHLNMTVSDPKATAAWLERVFGWRIRWEGPGMQTGYTVHIGDADTYVALFTYPETPAPKTESYRTKGGLNHWAVVVDDLDATEARVKAEGFTTATGSRSRSCNTPSPCRSPRGIGFITENQLPVSSGRGYSARMQQPASPPAPRSSVGGQVRALLALGLPLVGSHIAQMLISVTDTVMMGWYDVTDLAALSVSGPIFFILFIFGSGFAWAVTPMVASAIGQGDDRQTRRVTRMGLWLSIGFGALITPVFFFMEPILLAMGQDEIVARQAGRYMPLLGLGLIPALLVQALKSYLSALELTKAILYAVIGAALMNALVNYALICGNLGAPELGIVGAGVASLVSHLVSLAALLIYALRKRPDHALLKNFHRPDPEALARVFRIGLPIGLTLLAETGLFAASSIMMGWLGTIPLAAHGIALQIASVTFMVPLGLSQAVTVRVGGAWGRKDTEALRHAAIAGLHYWLDRPAIAFL